MHTITFYPVGNGDTSQIKLADGRRFLLDYRQHSKAGTDECTAIDLAARLRSELKTDNRSDVDVLALTHGDNDHIEGSTEFFWLDYAKQYQGDDRIKVKELWVPAAMILEEFEQADEIPEAKIWRQEARHRLINNYGIRVFSKPDKLKAFLEKRGLTLASRQHLITDAGQIVPGYTLGTDGIEIFCHSPFVKHCDEGDILRNEASLIFQVRFQVMGQTSNYFAVGDSEWSVLDDIVEITEWHGNHGRLDWDLYNIPHHCSYLALGPEKGATQTTPTAPVARLLGHGQPGAYIVSSSWPINNDREAYESVQPPHVQAKNTYKDTLRQVGGREFFVTMEEPHRDHPQPLVFEVMHGGIRLAQAATGGAFVMSTKPPRGG
ncbi:MAG: ComEC/Rec2 family competence protein [Sulfuricaulis sp.]